MKYAVKLLTVALFIMAVGFPVMAQQSTVSGTYTHVISNERASVTMSIEFSGISYSMALDGKPEGSGTFRVQGNTVYLGNSPSFTIIDETTLRASTNNQIWTKQQVQPGKLTITNFSRALTNNRFAVGHAALNDGTILFFAESPPSKNGCDGVKISGRSVTLNVYRAIDMDKILFEPFTGSGTARVGILDIVDIEVQNYWSSKDDKEFNNKVEIIFTNGNASINFGSQMKSK